MASRDKKSRPFEVTATRVAVLGGALAVSLFSVFLLGVLVGKQNAALHAPVEDRVARVPPPDEPRFRLAGHEPEPGSQPAEQAAADAGRDGAPPAGEAPATPDARADADAVAALLGGQPQAATPPPAAPRREDAAPAAGNAGSMVGPAPAAGAVAAALPVGPDAPAAAQSDRASKEAARLQAEQKAAEQKAADQKAKDDTARELAAIREKARQRQQEADRAEREEAADQRQQAAQPRGRGYTVQILATRKPADAEALLRKLQARGLAAYVRKVSDGAGASYRVRVGSYGTFGEASSMADRCRRDLGLGQAFVSTD